VKRYKNIRRGRKAQSIGELWENEIELRSGAIDNIIFIKQFPKMKFFGEGVAKVVGIGWADYIAIGKNIAFTFDAKTTRNKKSLTLPNKTKHQFVALQRSASIGIPSFYLVYWRTNNVVTVNMIDEYNGWPIKLSIDAEFSVDRNENWLNRVVNFVIRNKS